MYFASRAGPSFVCGLVAFATATLVADATKVVPAADQIAIKVIVLSGFEVGDDTGDAPGEFQYWAEREKHPATRLLPSGGQYPFLRPAMDSAFPQG